MSAGLTAAQESRVRSLLDAHLEQLTQADEDRYRAVPLTLFRASAVRLHCLLVQVDGVGASKIAGSAVPPSANPYRSCAELIFTETRSVLRIGSAQAYQRFMTSLSAAGVNVDEDATRSKAAESTSTPFPPHAGCMWYRPDSRAFFARPVLGARRRRQRRRRQQ